MLDKKLKKSLKDFGISIQSENPLILIGDDGDNFKGIAANAFISSIFIDDGDESDFSKLSQIDDNNYLLVSASCNWADEFDLDEWSTMTVTELKEIVKSLKKHKNEISWYFGSNEELSYDNGKDLLNRLSFKKITESEYQVLQNLFGGSFNGGGNIFDNIYETIYGGEDSDDDIIFDRTELKNIERLKKFGWTVTVLNEDKYLCEFKHVDGDIAITSTDFVNDLISYCNKIQ